MTNASMFIQTETHVSRLPVILISGFLGSGKTTLVNGLLAGPRLADTAVAVNEYGPAPLDHHLIENGEDGTVLLANGCLCCNVSGDLDEAVMRLYSRRDAGNLPRFRRMIIEPSGLADPAPIAQAILRNPIMSRALRLEAIITAVDAVFGEDQLARHPETRKQVMLADGLILTKTDLVSEDQASRLERLLREFNPIAPIRRADHGHVDAGATLPADFLDPDLAEDHPPRLAMAALAIDAEVRADHGERAVATVLTAEEPLRWRAFDAWLRDQRVQHGERLLRVKGLVHAIESRGPLVIQGVHHVLHPPVERAAWPDADRRTRILLITQGVDASLIAAAWRDALPQLIAVKAAAVPEGASSVARY
jgi:G3E family GTPase